MIFCNSFPISSSIWIQRVRIEAQRRRSVCEWSVDDICMSCNPANVSHASENVRRLQVEHMFDRHLSVKKIASRSMNESFRLASRARSVKQKAGLDIRAKILGFFDRRPTRDKKIFGCSTEFRPDPKLPQKLENCPKARIGFAPNV